MDLLEIMRSRRSVRRYTDEKISDDDLKSILSAALLAPSGHSKYPCEFIVVKNRELLEKMSHCRKSNIAKMLAGAAAAIVVVADKDKSDTFVEDSCVALMNMELLATSLGIGNCWIQVRGREAEDDSPAEEFLRGIVGFGENFACQAILSLGYPAREPKARELDKLNFDKVSYRD
ncbi:MAG: nitroreductase family protein [Selenomonadaceae bacterium]|nr:nitroreductase family protein [Selenomonadaceae bacterium]